MTNFEKWLKKHHPEYITLQQLSRERGIRISLISSYVSHNHLPGLKRIGTRWIVPKDVVIAPYKRRTSKLNRVNLIKLDR
jgi:translation initiation factor IF-1